MVHSVWVFLTQWMWCRTRNTFRSLANREPDTACFYFTVQMYLLSSSLRILSLSLFLLFASFIFFSSESQQGTDLKLMEIASSSHIVTHGSLSLSRQFLAVPLNHDFLSFLCETVDCKTVSKGPLTDRQNSVMLWI